MAEGARLESVFTRKGNVGSNPTLSAITFFISHLGGGDIYSDIKTVEHGEPSSQRHQACQNFKWASVLPGRHFWKWPNQA